MFLERLESSNQTTSNLVFGWDVSATCSAASSDNQGHKKYVIIQKCVVLTLWEPNGVDVIEDRKTSRYH